MDSKTPTLQRANNYTLPPTHTYYMTIHGNTAPLSIYTCTLQGDKLFTFLFTILMEPLLRWLVVGSRGYRPSYQHHKPTSTIITYDDHSYEDDVSITTGSIQDLKIQLKKLYLFSQYTKLELETSKCAATGSLWAHGNPPIHKSQTMLQEQIKSITFADGTHIKYLPSNKSYKMLGVHINPMLDFREHFHHINKDVKILGKALAKRKLSPPLKTLALEQLLKSKYHATHLGVFNGRQLTTIDDIFNKAMGQAIGLLPNFPTEGVQILLKEAGLNLFPMRDRSTQIGIEHLTRVMNKDTDKRFTAHAHVHRLLSQFNHWPHEALESNP